jgi:hypothetical protein
MEMDSAGIWGLFDRWQAWERNNHAAPDQERWMSACSEKHALREETIRTAHRNFFYLQRQGDKT